MRIRSGKELKLSSCICFFPFGQQLRFPVNEKIFRLASEAEDYHALCYLMKQASDKDYAYVKGLCDTHLPAGNIAMLKKALQKAQGGQRHHRAQGVYGGVF